MGLYVLLKDTWACVGGSWDPYKLNDWSPICSISRDTAGLDAVSGWRSKKITAILMYFHREQHYNTHSSNTHCKKRWETAISNEIGGQAHMNLFLKHCGGPQCFKKKFCSTQHIADFATQIVPLFFSARCWGDTEATGGPNQVMGAQGTLVVLVRAASEGLGLCHFQGDARTSVPVRAMWRPHCHFMVPSSDLFMESNQRKSMSMTFVVHLSTLAQEEEQERGRRDGRLIGNEKGRIVCTQDTRPLNSNL